jgi:hypothetical protein
MRSQRGLASALFALLASLSLLLTAQAQRSQHILITQDVDESKLVTLAGNTRLEANAKYDRGPLAGNTPISHMLLQLRRSPEQEQELRQLIDELADQSSPNFHRWLSSKEFGDRFGLAGQDRDTIKAWLQSHDLKVNVDYPSGMLIDFSGTAAQVQEAFHTEIHNLNVNGVPHISNMSDPRIPAALAPAVVGVVSLNDFRPHPLYKQRRDYTAGGGYYLVAPGDLAKIYNLNPLFTAGTSGQGQTIVVIEDTDVYSTSDWTTFRSTFGLSSYTGGSFTQVHPASSGTNDCSDPGVVVGNDAEAILDAEYASAAAPSAAIELASCNDTTTTFGGLLALQNLLNASSTPPAVVSISYGECEAENGSSANQAYYSTYQQGAAEGVSIFVSSGDEGAASCNADESNATDGIGVSGFTSTPYNVSVGGTDFGDTYAGTNSTYWSASNSSTYESALSYVPEIPWDDSCASVLLATYSGYSETYGTSGFCNSSLGKEFLTTGSGSGGPSGCATGSPSISGVVGGSCAGWPKPSWQSLVGNPSDGVRDIPDVSLFAADGVWGHYYPFCYTDPNGGGSPCTGAPDNWAGAGGTSFASPIMAGIQALVNQKTGARQGNPNSVYYTLAAGEYGAGGDSSCSSTLGNAVATSCIFYDVTQGDMDINCTGTHNCYKPSGSYGVLSTSNSAYDKAYGTQTGWDFATGIGTVNAANLVSNWPASTPNFKLSANPTSVTVSQGNSGTSTITIAPSNGFNGTVTLSASGLPSGVTATFGTNPATTTSTLTLAASATATTGAVTVTVQGVSGALTNTTTLKLTVAAAVQSFTLSAAPNAVTIAKGGASGASTVTIAPVNGFSGNVTLAASGLPTGVTASFSPNPATSTSVLTLTASSTAKAGTATVTIKGTSGSLTATTTLSLTVNALGGFSLTAAPTSLTIVKGNSGTSIITVDPTGGFDQNVTLTASGMPTGVTASFSPNPATSASTLTLAVSDAAAVAKSTITVTGTYGSLSHTAKIKLSVTQ